MKDCIVRYFITVKVGKRLKTLVDGKSFFSIIVHPSLSRNRFPFIIFFPRYKNIPDITGIGMFPRKGRRSREKRMEACMTNPVRRVSITSEKTSLPPPFPFPLLISLIRLSLSFILARALALALTVTATVETATATATATVVAVAVAVVVVDSAAPVVVDSAAPVAVVVRVTVAAWSIGIS